jgi:glycine/D-amino acid oxidase-like deaminating enzyme
MRNRNVWIVAGLALALALGALAGCGGEPRAGEAGESYDIVVYGATSAGVSAAVQAARMGRSVALVGPDLHLGGLSSGGLGWTDTGNKAVIGGIAREFYHRVWLHYQKPEAWKWQTRSPAVRELGCVSQPRPAVSILAPPGATASVAWGGQKYYTYVCSCEFSGRRESDESANQVWPNLSRHRGRFGLVGNGRHQRNRHLLRDHSRAA